MVDDFLDEINKDSMIHNECIKELIRIHGKGNYQTWKERIFEAQKEYPSLTLTQIAQELVKKAKNGQEF